MWVCELIRNGRIVGTWTIHPSTTEGYFWTRVTLQSAHERFTAGPLQESELLAWLSGEVGAGCDFNRWRSAPTWGSTLCPFEE
jgi:hypothetical protein